MALKLSCYQLKIEGYNATITLCRPCVNHLEKTYTRYPKENEKRIKANHYIKQSRKTMRGGQNNSK